MPDVMDSRSSASQPDKALRRKRFLELSLFRALCCYTLGSLLEVWLMTLRISGETQVLVALAEDLLAKFGILLLSSLLFGFSFIVFRPQTLPSAAKRFMHILVVFLPIVLVSQSLVVDADLDMQAYVAYYFFATLLYLAVYGLCMLISSIIRRKKAVQQ